MVTSLCHNNWLLTQFCAKIFSLQTYGVRGSLDSKKAMGRGAFWHGRTGQWEEWAILARKKRTNMYTH